jgi:hypothetical protein
MAGPRKPSQKETRVLLKLARELNWQVKEVKNGWRLLAPDGEHTASIHASQSRNGWDTHIERTIRLYGRKT